MVLSSVSGMMEKKIKLLENRLSLVERFVEMRFCESFRDFSIRNNSLINGEDDNDNTADSSGEGGGESSTVSMRIIKVIAEEDKVKSPVNCGSSPSRRSTRILAKKKALVKIPIQKVTPKTKEVLKKGQEVKEDDGGDDYFTFPSGGGGGGDQEEVEGMEETIENEDDNDNWSEADEGKSPPKKKKVVRGSSSSSSSAQKVKRRYKVRQRILNESPENLLSTKECEICHVQCKPSAYPDHLAMHGKERHLKCGFCEKRFHNKAMLFKHERIHQPEKYGKYCRVKGCGKMIIQTTRMLGHERSCIRKALEGGGEVDREVMEEVRRRSRNVELNWPGEGEGKRRCKLCGGREVEGKEWLKHMRGHARWKCDKCGDKRAVFTEKRSLLRHYRHFHGDKGGGGSGEEEAVKEGDVEIEIDGQGIVVEVIAVEEVDKILEN